MTKTSRIGRRAVVLGAGMGGLAAAGALAPHFDLVSVLERDHLPAEPGQRLGAPQGRHVHALLTAGQRALEGLYPGFTDAIVAAGAVAVRANADTRVEMPGYDPFPQRDFGWRTYCLSRPLIEFTARRLAQERGVEFHPRRRVRRLETSEDGAAIAAVHSEGDDGKTERLAADVVVDATGRAHPTLDLLKALGRPVPPETLIGVDLSYASAVFEIPAGAPSDWQIVMTMPQAGQSTRGGLLAPLEGGRWIVSLGGRQEDAPPDDGAGYLEFARGLRTQTIYNAIKNAKREGEIARYGFRESTWRHFEKLAPLPRGLVPFADSVCRFNPVYGQGMSVAALEAGLLSRLLAEAAAKPDPLADLSQCFLAEAQAIIAPPWEMSAIPDFANPLTRGERPANLQQIFGFAVALTVLAARDPDVHKLDAEVRQLLKPPSALMEPALVARVMEVANEMQVPA